MISHTLCNIFSQFLTQDVTKIIQKLLQRQHFWKFQEPTWTCVFAPKFGEIVLEGKRATYFFISIYILNHQTHIISIFPDPFLYLLLCYFERMLTQVHSEVWSMIAVLGMPKFDPEGCGVKLMKLSWDVSLLLIKALAWCNLHAV